MRIIFWGAFACVLAVLAGCGQGLPPTVKLGGKVTLDGKALPTGVILFYPADKDGASPVAAPVTDGQYLAPVVPQGIYRVAFRSSSAPAGYGQASEPVDSTVGAPTKEALEKKNAIPERYQTASLPADASADNLNLNFDLTSK